MSTTFSMKIKCANLDLLSQGTIICSENDEIVFEILKNAYISFSFENDNENKDIQIEKKAQGNKLCLIFKNFNNSLGTSVTGPMPIGIINNQQILLTATVYSVGKIGNSSKTVSYNFYLKEAQ